MMREIRTVQSEFTFYQPVYPSIHFQHWYHFSFISPAWQNTPTFRVLKWTKFCKFRRRWINTVFSCIHWWFFHIKRLSRGLLSIVPVLDRPTEQNWTREVPLDRQKRQKSACCIVCLSSRNAIWESEIKELGEVAKNRLGRRYQLLFVWSRQNDNPSSPV